MRKRERVYKKVLALVLAVIICSSNISWEAFATNNQAIPRETYLNIPNSYLRSSIWKAIDNTERDDKIPASRLEDIKKITGVFEPHEWTSNITGLQYLSGISGVKLTTFVGNNLIFPKMDNLKTIVCTEGQAQTLYVGQLKNLEELDCSKNFIMTLDITRNTKLKTVNCAENTMYQLNLGDKPDLTSLNVSNNNLMGLDLEGAPLLKAAGAVLNFENQGVNARSPEQMVTASVEERDTMLYVGLDIKGILGEQCIGRIKNPTFPSTDDSSCFDEAVAKFEAPDAVFGGAGTITYNYQVFGPLDDSIVMPVKIQFDFTSYAFNFQYLEADGITWTTSGLYEQSDLSGQSFADKAPIPPVITGYEFIGWDRSVDYVTYGGTFTAVYEEPKIPHTVTFQDYDGTTIGQPQQVAHGGSAVEPAIPAHDGLAFFKWDQPLDNITSDNVVITASYTVSRFDDAAFRNFVWKDVLKQRADPFDNALTDAHNIYTSDLPVIKEYKTSAPLELKGATNINGIEYFEKLESLSIYGNTNPVTIKSIDLSKNTNLTYLQLCYFDLEELELGTNPNLRIVRVYNTKLKALDVSGCQIGQGFVNELGDLTIRDNALESLTLGSQPKLITAFIDNNPKLGNIDVTQCPELGKLMLSNTGTTAINVTKNPKLKSLDVSYNRMTTLNITENAQLENLSLTGGTPQFTQIWGNKVENLNLSNNPELRTLQCEFNKITKLNLEKNSKLINVHCQGNEFTSLDVSLAADLKYFDCTGNKLNALDVRANTKLVQLKCSSNSSISTLDFRSNPDLAFLSCSGMNLKTLDLSGQSRLQYLNCESNFLYQLDLHPNAFDPSAALPLGVQRWMSINPQRPRTINPLLNTGRGKFEYAVNSLFGISAKNMYRIPASIENVSFGTDLAAHGSYDAANRRITFDTFDVTPFTYQYNTGNTRMVNTSSAEFLKVMLIPNFGTFYKVTYYDGVQGLLEVDAPENGTLTRPAGIPGSKTGYQFNGWYKDPEMTKPWNFAVDTVTAKTDLYAKWTQKEYKVTFYSKGGTQVLPVEKLHYDDFVPEPLDVVLPGKTLTEWYKEETYQNKWDFTMDKLTSDMKLFARWQDKKYAVQYDMGTVDVAGIPEKTNVLYEDVSLLPSDPVRAGYDFAGWKCGKTTVTAASKYRELVADDTVGSITLEAQWTARHFYVSYDSNGGNSVSNKTGVIWDDAELLPLNCKRPGYSIKNWSMGEKTVSAETKYRDLTSENRDGTSILLTAKWNELEDYSVIYDVDGGTMPAGTDLSVTGLKYAGKVPVPELTKAGHTFQNWSYQKTKVKADSMYSDLEKNDEVKTIGLKAVWKVNEYYVNLDVKGGEKIPDLGEIHYGDKLKRPENPRYPGQSFDGWFKDDACTLPWNFENDRISDTTTLHAKWTAKRYGVFYQTNSPDSSVDSRQDVLYLDNGLLPGENPFRRGYDFVKWTYKDTLIDVNTKYKELAADDGIMAVTLAADWNPHLFTIYYDTGYEDVVVEELTNVKWDDTNLASRQPKKEGFGFKGWAIGGRQVTAEQKYGDLTEEDADKTALTMTAQWEELKDSDSAKNTGDVNTPAGGSGGTSSVAMGDTNNLVLLLLLILLSGITVMVLLWKRKKD